MIYTKISRQLIESLEFRPFTKQDWYGFQGCESPVPMIAENDDEGILVIIDGDYCELYAADGDGGFEPIDTCDSIRQLPFKSLEQIAIEAEIATMEKALAALRAKLL
jgi:hypothetical protein